MAAEVNGTQPEVALGGVLLTHAVSNEAPAAGALGVEDI